MVLFACHEHEILANAKCTTISNLAREAVLQGWYSNASSIVAAVE